MLLLRLGLVASLALTACAVEMPDEEEGETSSAVKEAGIVVRGFGQGGPRVKSWGYDVKQDGAARKLVPALAKEIFGEVGMNLIRVPVRATLGHPKRGEVVGAAYADDLEAIANAKAAKPGVPVFASLKLLGKETFPAWVKQGGEVDAARYAELIEDYLAYMKSKGVAVDWLGIDCERKWNEGNITPGKYATIVGRLKAWAKQNDVKEPGFIAAEDYGPGDTASWTNQLANQGDFALVDRVGVHLYSKHREPSYLDKMDDVVDASRQKGLWDSELHWNDFDDDGVKFDEIKAGMLLAFDHFDRGFESMTWWSFKPRSEGTKSSHVQSELVQATVGASVLATSDGSGDDRMATQRLSARGFENDASHATVWVLNFGAARKGELTQIGGQKVESATYVQWTSTSAVGGAKGNAELVGKNPAAFRMDYPAGTITRVSVTLK